MTVGTFLGACGLDLVFGDPRRFPHPVRGIGGLIEWGHGRFAGACTSHPVAAKVSGSIVAVGLPAASALVVWSAIRAADLVNVAALIEMLFAFWALAARDLADHAWKVSDALNQGRTEEARRAVGLIVGRDTAALPEPEIVRATVETVAESSCDGIVAPIFFLAIGGAPLAWAYKTINTLDSMIGHREFPYRDIGWGSARVDDAMNWIPARLTAMLIVAAAGVRFASLRRLREGWRTLIDDGGNHPSPNSGRPEAAMAGVLGVQLGGTNWYEGRPESRPAIGTAREPMTAARITEAVCLMWIVFMMAALLACWVLW
ncbi:MAG TPA: adenosylcobinamide-phosphate synthase CbiB [Nitrospiraceae bacterium]|nr:adenosylcobinamide-phosphate synthase CbiB [Nitrospiraceae bacterium]